MHAAIRTAVLLGVVPAFLAVLGVLAEPLPIVAKSASEGEGVCLVERRVTLGTVQDTLFIYLFDHFTPARELL